MTAQPCVMPSFEVLINELEAKLVELRSANSERWRELIRESDQIANALNSIDGSVVTRVSLLVARGVSPVIEKIDNGFCRFKRIRLHALLIRDLKERGFAMCPECNRIAIPSR